jgi:hypothetical protein
MAQPAASGDQRRTNLDLQESRETYICGHRVDVLIYLDDAQPLAELAEGWKAFLLQCEPEVRKVLHQSRQTLVLRSVGQAHDEGTPAAMASDEAIALEPAQRFSYGFAAHAKLVARLVFTGKAIRRRESVAEALHQDVADLQISAKRIEELGAEVLRRPTTSSWT